MKVNEKMIYKMVTELKHEMMVKNMKDIIL